MTADVRSNAGLRSNLFAVLAYMLGAITGVLLLVVERRDQYVRFHAMQSTLMCLLFLVVTLIIGSVPVVGTPLNIVASFAMSVLWFVLMFKAFTGQRYKLPYVGEIAERQIR